MIFVGYSLNWKRNSVSFEIDFISVWNNCPNGYFKKPVQINRRIVYYEQSPLNHFWKMWEDTIGNQSKKVNHKKFPSSTFLLWKEDCPNQEPLFNTFQKSILMCQHQFCRIKTKVLLIKSYGELFLWNSCYPIIDDFCFWKNSFPWNP